MAYNDIEEHFYWELPAHGGLTFSGSLGGGRPYGHWIGFDCAHSHDISPMTPAKLRSYFEDATYKDMDYAENNIKEIIDFIIKETEK